MPYIKLRLLTNKFNKKICLVTGFLLVFLVLSISGQEKKVQKKTPVANPADVASIDSIIKATFDIITGPVGKIRDWDRFRSLFTPNAQFIVAPLQKGENRFNLKARNIDDYIRESNPWLIKNGTFEKEVHRITERYGQMAHIYSTSEYRPNITDLQPTTRYLNSFQLMYDGQRWWIVNWFWVSVQSNNPIPDKYLPSKK